MGRSPVWKKIFSIVVLWLAVLVGGTILVNLLNAFQPFGLRYKPGDLGYYVMGIIGGPVGVYLGKEAMEKLTARREHIFRAVNYIVVAVFTCCVAMFSTLVNGLDLYYLLLEGAIAVCAGICAADEFKQQDKENNDGHNT